MDGPEFDKLARKLTSFASRRQALGGLLGAAAALTGVAAEAKKGNGKNRDNKKGDKGKGKPGKQQCTSGCTTTDTAPGGGGLGGCTNDADCPGATVCRNANGTNRCVRACAVAAQCGNNGIPICLPAGFCGCAGDVDCPDPQGGATGFRCVGGVCARPGVGGVPAGLCTAGVYPGGVGPEDSACGANGLACTNCNLTGRRCIPLSNRAGGTCQTSINCPGVSCQLFDNSANVCVNPEDPRICGSRNVGGFGRICNPGCPSGQVCTGTGIGSICQAQTCTATTCPNGCCQGNRCRLPGIDQTNEFCGRGGVACQNCTFVCGSANNGCLNGQCTCTTTTTTTTTTSTTTAPQTCDAQSCPNGCCTSPTAACTPSSRQTCGINGAACVNCRANNNKRCRNGRCRKN